MTVAARSEIKRRYEDVAEHKAGGATYTPTALARFVAGKIVAHAELEESGTVRILDPAIGDGELVLRLLEHLPPKPLRLAVTGFDTDPNALKLAGQRIGAAFPDVQLELEQASFLDFVLAQASDASGLFGPRTGAEFDLIIANPPYVRTQIIGADHAQALGRLFHLSGRIDLYHAFLMGIARVLRPGGAAGVIVSNRFMTTKGGASVRAALRNRVNLQHIWDFGDTKLFDAAVLPAVLLASGGPPPRASSPGFTSIYETTQQPTASAADPLEAVELNGVVALSDNRRFEVMHGALDTSGDAYDVWRIATQSTDDWLKTIARHSWGVFRDIGKVRVGVKTCADKVFIRTDWDSLHPDARPELLKPLITHHTAGRFRAVAASKDRSILYPHEVKGGQRRPVDLSNYPKSRAYLEEHRAKLEARSYLMEAGRNWYELWVPQDPAAWPAPKLVFRDISKRPTFWVDLEGGVVNGDCYWLAPEAANGEDLLWLAAAVANSTFIEAFYDRRFNNKLYAGRRRFITQYVELFPLPDPGSAVGRQLIQRARMIHATVDRNMALQLEADLDALVWQAFGLPVEEVVR